MNKIHTGFKLNPQNLDILNHIQKKTGVNRTVSCEKLIQDLGKELAETDPEMAVIMAKIPKDYEQDEVDGTGPYTKRWTRTK